MAMFDVKALVNSPLEIIYPLGPQGKIKTIVTGEARNIATVIIYSGSMIVYTGTMTQTAPNLVASSILNVGDLVMKNTTFKLTIPTEYQMGSNFMTTTFKSGDNPEQPFSGVVASWTLTS